MKRSRRARTEKGFESWLGNNEGFLRWLIKNYYYGKTEHADMFQEACVAAWKGYFSYDPSKRVKLNSYIGKCVRNCITDIYAKETALRRPKTVPIGLGRDFDDGMSDYILYEEDYPSDYQHLVDALNGLKEEDKWIIMETLFSNKTQQELAEECGCGQSLISYRLNRARKALKEKIA